MRLREINDARVNFLVKAMEATGTSNLSTALAFCVGKRTRKELVELLRRVQNGDLTVDLILMLLGGNHSKMALDLLFAKYPKNINFGAMSLWVIEEMDLKDARKLTLCNMVRESFSYLLVVIYVLW